MTIEVIALNWKWLFIYPDERIATINFVEFPANTPIDFKITADAPMNSFWIPQLAGQIYAMPGMVTHLQVEGAPGEYSGVSSNLSGKGFAGMRFVAKAVSRNEFDQWVRTVRPATPYILDEQTYAELRNDSENEPVTFFGLGSYPIFNSVVDSYMSSKNTNTMNGMNMHAL